MSNFERVVNAIFSASTDQELDHLSTELGKIGEFFQKNRTNFEGAISALDPRQHTLGLIHILNGIISGGSKFDKPIFIKTTQSVIVHGSIKQIRMEPKRFAAVCRKFVEVCIEVKQPMRAIKPMRTAINKIAPSEHLTPQHYLLALACIASKNYKASLSTLDKFVYLIDPKVSGVRSEDTRLYYYYGGICYIAVKEWEKAIEFFETVIAAPAMMTSAIMVEAYKKLILCNLIHKGESGNLPKFTNPSVARVIKQIAQPYEELALAFSTLSMEDLLKAIENNCEPFVKDNNLGLVGQVKNSLAHKLIKRLTCTYLTITTTNLVEEVGAKSVQDAESHVIKMIDASGFKAKINQQLGYISFQSSDGYDDDSAVNNLNNHIQQTILIHKQVSSLDRSIEKSEKYVQKILQSEKFPGRDSDLHDGRSSMSQFL